MPKNHSAYSGGNRDYVLTIEGARADDWIEADMFNVIATDIGDSRRMTPIPYSQRDTPLQWFGYQHWRVVQRFEGNDSPAAQQLWEQYGL